LTHPSCRTSSTKPADEKPTRPLISSQELLQSGFDRLKAAVFTERFIPSKFHPRGAKFEPNSNITRTYIRCITIEESHQLRGHGSDVASISPEAYTLAVSADGVVLITILSPQGGLHAFSTLFQLFYAHSASPVDVYTPLAPVTITDSPAFAHRGLNLDIARNPIPPDAVLRIIPALALSKYNILHIHATDSQSWPLEIPSLPALSANGAYDPTQVWTAADLRAVQLQAAAHGIALYLELDLPGHTAALHHARPDLIAAYDARPWQTYSAEPPAGQLKLNDSAVPAFLTALFADLLPRARAASPLFHLGGDELNLAAHTLDPSVNSSSRAVLRPLLQALVDHALNLTAAHGMTPLVWEELLLDWELALPPHTIVQTWRSQRSLATVLEKGHRGLFGPSTAWYLDCGLGGFIDPDPANPTSPIQPPYRSWCPPYKNWRVVYAYRPLEGVPEDLRHLVLGGEVHLWGELTDEVSLDGMLWPRTAAAGEVLWRGEGLGVGEPATRRLAEMRERLVRKGIRAGVVQMEWCLRNEGACVS
jgi:hexosaminidase